MLPAWFAAPGASQSMYMQFRRWLATGCLAVLTLPGAALAQDSPPPTPVAPLAAGAPDSLLPIRSACSNVLPSPAAQPPDRSASVLLFVELCFGKQGGTPILPGETYSYYIHSIPLVSLPSKGTWTPYTSAV